MKATVEELRKEMETLFNACGFDNIEDECCFADFANRHTLPDDVWYEFGASRIVLGYNDGEYVFKMDDDFADEEDFTKKEYEVYQLAKEEGLAEYFAEEVFVGTYVVGKYEVEVYAMERANIDYDGNSERGRESRFREYCEDNGIINPNAEVEDIFFSHVYSNWDEGSAEDMFSVASEEWGYSEAYKVQRFCEDHEVNDLHAGNWGYVDDRWVITDYAGF